MIEGTNAKTEQRFCTPLKAMLAAEPRGGRLLSGEIFARFEGLATRGERRVSGWL
jgi:hypothetical protein